MAKETVHMSTNQSGDRTMKNGITGLIFFVENITRAAEFYQKKLGFRKLKSRHFPETEWVEFDAGGCWFALHAAKKSGAFQNNWNKIVMYSRNVPKRRTELIAKGVKMGEIFRFKDIELCDGEDPDGNRFQISNHQFGSKGNVRPPIKNDQEKKKRKPTTRGALSA
jgi:catechol 2,3-dioxygenase-like lactoylglutathione lyase family enzyme